jgi:uncharacterized RDD family membrane protein YckC
MPRAGFAPRAAALLLDLGLMFGAVHALAAVDVLANDAGRINDFGRITFAGSGVVLVAYSLLDVLAAGTLGKGLMRLRIAAADGRPARPGALLGRWAAKHAFFLPLAAGGWLLGITLSPYSNVRLQPYVMEGLFVVGVADALVCAAVLAFVVAGCVRVSRPRCGRRAFHDVVSGTAVFVCSRLGGRRGFDPLPVLPAADDDTASRHHVPSPGRVGRGSSD